MDNLSIFSSYGLSAAFGLLFVFILIITIIGIATGIIMIVSNWKIFKKAGLEGWEALIPFYNLWCLVKISGLEWWFFLIIILPILSIKFPLIGLISLIAVFFVNYNLSIKFEKEPIGFAIGLTLLPFIFYPILGFGKSIYKAKEVSPYGLIEKK